MPTPPSRASASAPAPFFPLARYTSVVGVHTSLLAFTALFLPRTSLSALVASFASGSYKPAPAGARATANASLPLSGASQIRSADRPEHPFLTALTHDPLATLGWLCVGAAVLQTWWAVQLRGWEVDYRQGQIGGYGSSLSEKAERAPTKKGRLGLDQDDVRAAGQVAGFVLAVTALYALILVLFGAPLSSHIPHTLLLSLLLSLLTSLTPAHVLRPPFSTSPSALLRVFARSRPSKSEDMGSLTLRLTWTRLFAELSATTPVEIALLYPTAGALVGAWAGAIPIGLDWDRPWQAYPLTPAYGALLGYIAGALGACAVSSVQYFAQVDRDREHAAAESTQAGAGTAGASTGKGKGKGKGKSGKSPKVVRFKKD